jgi:hypothetical protein
VDVMNQVEDQVNAAVAGATSCAADDDCVLVSTPCLITNACGFAFWAVNRSNESTVEHAFSVTAAETCGDCTPTSLALGGSCGVPVSSRLTAGSECDAGTCVVIGIPPDAGPPGAFEWSCGNGCDETGVVTGAAQYCDVSAVTTACAQGGYVVVADGGSCVLRTTFSTSCTGDSDCDFGQACNAFTETCTSVCPSLQPVGCDAGCLLTSDNHACHVCWCPHGCPPT